jgi:hypothetical protein
LIIKPEEKIPLRRHKIIREDNIKKDLRIRGLEDVVLIHLA